MTRSVLTLCNGPSCSVVEGEDGTDVEIRSFSTADALFGKEHALVTYEDGNLTLYSLDDERT